MKNSTARLWLLAFFVTAAFHLVALQLLEGVVIPISKGLLMPLLAIYAYAQYSYISPRLKRTLLAALFFSWLGDVLLAIQQPGMFLAGLGAFLVAHLTYIVAYGYASGNYPLKKVWWRWWYWLPILGYGSAFAAWLIPKLATDLQIPVAVYSLVLVIMLLAAAGRGKYTHPTSFLLVLLGATFFVASDSLIAVNRFVTPMQNGSFMIMFTYIIGQWLIVEGLLRHPSPVRH